MKNMRIRTILGLGFNLTILIIIVSIIVLSYSESKKVIELIEDVVIKDEIENGLKLLDLSGADLEQWAIDYAVWDDTYNRIDDPVIDLEFMDENFGDWMPEYYGVSTLYLLDRNFDIVYSYDDSQELFNILKNSTFIQSVLNVHEYNYALKYHGLLKHEGTLFQIAISPVLKSDTSGPNMGLLILLKPIDKELITTFEETTGRHYFFTYDSQLLAVNGSFNINNDDIMSFEGIYKNESHIYTKSLLTDINGNQCGYLGIQKERSIYNNTKRLLIKNAIYILLISLTLLAGLRFTMLKYVLTPIKEMENQLGAMDQSDSLAHILIKGPEEIITCSRTFNNMIDKLFDAHKTTESLTLLTNTDELTGLYNHRYIFEHFNSLQETKKEPIYAILVDIDRFKMVNEAVGYNMGDLYLRQVATLMKDIIKIDGTIFRYSGEIFLALIPEMTEITIYNVAERIRKGIESAAYFKDYNLHFPITASIGIAAYPDDGLEISEVLLNAEYAINYSKFNGRNQITRYTSNLEHSINKELVDEYQEIEHLIDSVMAMAEAIDSKDSYTGKHSHSVAEVSILIAEKLNLNQIDKDDLRIGALLHDTGKIGLSDAILHKKDQLTPAEYSIIKSHPKLGYNIVRHFVRNKDILACVRNHHERWDGRGYPDQMLGDRIPLFARIISAADTYHAMASQRPYRKALSNKKIIQEFRAHSNTQFDPKIATIMVDLINDGSLNYLDQYDT